MSQKKPTRFSGGSVTSCAICVFAPTCRFKGRYDMLGRYCSDFVEVESTGRV